MNRREFMKSVSAVGLIALFPFKVLASVFTRKEKRPKSIDVLFTREEMVRFDYKSLVVEGKVFASGKWAPFKEVLEIESSANESKRDFLRRVLVPKRVLISRLLKKYPGTLEICEICVVEVEK